eukprot:2171347-Pyramimonas_sp.AAC.1
MEFLQAVNRELGQVALDAGQHARQCGDALYLHVHNAVRPVAAELLQAQPKRVSRPEDTSAA